MDASWLTKYPRAAAMLQRDDDRLEYAPDGCPPLTIGDAADTPAADVTVEADPFFAHGVPPWDETQGVTTVPMSYGPRYRHHIPCRLTIIMDPAAVIDVSMPVCTTDWPALVCACGAWRLRWERDRRP